MRGSAVPLLFALALLGLIGSFILGYLNPNLLNLLIAIISFSVGIITILYGVSYGISKSNLILIIVGIILGFSLMYALPYVFYYITSQGYTTAYKQTVYVASTLKFAQYSSYEELPYPEEYEDLGNYTVTKTQDYLRIKFKIIVDPSSTETLTNVKLEANFYKAIEEKFKLEYRFSVSKVINKLEPGASKVLYLYLPTTETYVGENGTWFFIPHFYDSKGNNIDELIEGANKWYKFYVTIISPQQPPSNETNQTLFQPPEAWWEEQPISGGVGGGAVGGGFERREIPSTRAPVKIEVPSPFTILLHMFILGLSIYLASQYNII